MELLTELFNMALNEKTTQDSPSKKSRSKVNNYYYRRTRLKSYRQYDPEKHAEENK